MHPKHTLFQVTLEMAEKIYSLPVEEREAALLQMVKEHKAKLLGTTDKSGPELAVEFIKAGIKAQSYMAPKSEKKA